MTALASHLPALARSSEVLPATSQAFVAGFLTAMTALGLMGFRKFHRQAFLQTSLFTLSSLAAWTAFSGLASQWVSSRYEHQIITMGLLLMALSLAALGHIPFGRLVAPRGEQSIRHMGQSMTIAAMLVAVLALLPWDACHLAAAALLGTLPPLLSVLSLIRATSQADLLRAHGEDQNAELALRMKELEAAHLSAESANREIQHALDQLEQAASTDRLTGAWNRRHFEQAAQSELALANRRSDPLSLLMFDLDHFKRVNDTHGHLAGDAVLVGTAQTVRDQLRASDALVRWGGEEFLVLLPATTKEGALALAEKLRAAVAGLTYPGVGQVTVSLGVAVYAPGESLTAWIDRVDAALYRAKGQGRDRVELAPTPTVQPALPPKTLLQMIWEDDYASGHPMVDAQHQALFRMASLLLAGLTENLPREEIGLRMQLLIAHTAQHFLDEEDLLRAAQYPDLTHHTAIHAKLLGHAQNLHHQVIQGHTDFGALVSFLAKDLVMGHLLTEDKNYFALLAALPSVEGGG